MRGAQRATTLTQRLLAFSRRQPLNPKNVDLSKFIVGAAEFLQRSLGETIELESVIGAGVSGLTVAHDLVRIGYRDRMSFVRYHEDTAVRTILGA